MAQKSKLGSRVDVVAITTMFKSTHMNAPNLPEVGQQREASIVHGPRIMDLKTSSMASGFPI